jgi:hypothetical protein
MRVPCGACAGLERHAGRIQPRQGRRLNHRSCHTVPVK